METQLDEVLNFIYELFEPFLSLPCCLLISIAVQYRNFLFTLPKTKLHHNYNFQQPPSKVFSLLYFITQVELLTLVVF